MQKKLPCIMFVFALLQTTGLASSVAWSPVTHAYIADEIGKPFGVENLNEIYGSMAPDLFNLDFSLEKDPELSACITEQTHSTKPENAVELWTVSEGGLSRAAAFGYISHNNAFGADYAAHISGKTNASGMGWVIEKARDLIEIMEDQGAWDALGIDIDEPGDFGVAELICHVMVEFAGDTIIKRNNPDIGTKVAMSAMVRTPKFPDRLAEIITCVDEDYLREAEKQFRNQTMAYGVSFLLDEDLILNTISSQLASLAAQFFETYAGTALTEEQAAYVPTLATEGLARALSLIEEDFMIEINAVVADLEYTMEEYGVSPYASN